MTVGALINVLSRLPQDLKIAVHADNHLAENVESVSMLKHYAGPRVLIGNQSKKKLNPPNWEVTQDLCGPILPDEWWKPGDK